MASGIVVVVAGVPLHWSMSLMVMLVVEAALESSGTSGPAVTLNDEVGW